MAQTLLDSLYTIVIPIAFALAVLIGLWLLLKAVLLKTKSLRAAKFLYTFFLSIGLFGIGVFVLMQLADMGGGAGISPLFLFLAWRIRKVVIPRLEQDAAANPTESRNSKIEVRSWIKSYGLKAAAVILLAAAIGNYFYTFSGFVAQTQEERRACQLYAPLRVANDTGGSEAVQEIYEGLSSENKKVLSNYAPLIKEANRRCKPIQQFYIEEAGLLLAALGLGFGRKIRKSV